MMRDKTFTLFDAVTGVPAQLHYHDVFAIEWHGHHKLNFERAIIGYKSGGRLELFMSAEDADAVRKWMMRNGAVHTILTSGMPEGRIEHEPAPPTGSYPVPVFAEKREHGDRRRGQQTYIGENRRQGDRRHRGEENE